MKRYRTFGEVLAFIREHIDECKSENIYFGVSFNGYEEVVTYSTPCYLLTLLYTIDQISGIVVDVTDTESDYLIDNGKYLLIKVLT